jgi:alcohol dehydrogenase class IV
MKFEFSTAQRIIFGNDEIHKLPQLLADFGNRYLLVVGFDAWNATPAPELLTQAKTTWLTYRVSHEPTINTIDEGVRLAREMDAEAIIGLGGGSAMDTAKAVAAMVHNPGTLLDYLEVIGAGRPLQSRSLPVIAIPTTAGTGAEVTRNAVIGSPKHRVKVSLRNNTMIPAVALVDPKMTLGLPKPITVASGLDALTQVVEPFVSVFANPVTDALCREAIRTAATALPNVHRNGDILEYREAMAFVSLIGGIALTNARLGAVHGFAGPFGGMYDAPHGAVCGRLLPAVMQMNIKKIRSQTEYGEKLKRYQQIAALIFQDAAAAPEAATDWVSELVERFEIPRLGEYGLRRNEFDDLVNKAQASSSMKGNPVRLSDEDCLEILEASI